MAYICTKPNGSCASCQYYQYDVDYGAKVCYEHLYRKYENIEPGTNKKENDDDKYDEFNANNRKI